MKRRSAIKNLTIALGSLVSVPTWAKSWTPSTLGRTTILPAHDEAVLAEIVETIIPETSTPGAKSLQVHQFVQRMVVDCYGNDAKTVLTEGVKMTDDWAQQQFQKSFTACSATERKDIFLKISGKEEGKKFSTLVKNLTVQGYTNSEYYLQNIAGYNMAPGFYHGCVPVKK